MKTGMVKHIFFCQVRKVMGRGWPQNSTGAKGVWGAEQYTSQDGHGGGRLLDGSFSLWLSSPNPDRISDQKM